MNRKAVREIIVGLIGFSLIAVGVRIAPLFFLAWVGVWTLIAAVAWHWHRIRKEARKQGREVVLT